MKRFLNNLKFKIKILFIVGALFFVTATVGGITYYHYAAQDVEKNFKAGAEDVLTQLTDTLDLRLNAVEMRVRGLVSNTTFMRTMVNYLNKPDEKNRVKALGEVASFLKDLESGESLVHSSYIYTDKGDFENFIRMRNWSFDFKTSKFYQVYQEQGVLAVQWFPTQKDEIFKDEDDVIPYVRRFTLDGYYHGGYQYLVVQLKKAELDRILSGKYGYFDQLLIVNENGEFLAGSDGVNTKKLIEIVKPSVKNGSAAESTYEQNKIKYLVFSDTLDTTGWRIFGLRSRDSLLGSLQSLRVLIAEFTVIIFLTAFAALLLVSNSLTAALTRLEKRMSIVQGGDFEVRFFYPYQDEVGSLARSFNCMLDEIERLVKKQDETIQELKRERDFVAEVQKQKRKAELKALQAQINPHFLYNTFNLISSIAGMNGIDSICKITVSISEMFRYSIQENLIVQLQDELREINNYVTIQTIRFKDRLYADFDVEEEVLKVPIPIFLLQPLVENAIIHGLEPKAESGYINIVAYMEDDFVEILIRDNGVGIPQDKLCQIIQSLEKEQIESISMQGHSSIGIKNVNQRIKAYYGAEYGLHLESRVNVGTTISIRLPKNLTKKYG